jgi:hypothetical protein
MGNLLLKIELKDIIPWIITAIATAIAFFNYLNSRKQRKIQEHTAKVEQVKFESLVKEKNETEIIKNQTILSYCDYIIRQYKFFSFRGIGVGGIRMELNRTYIKLRVKGHFQYLKLLKYEKSGFKQDREEYYEKYNNIDFEEIFITLKEFKKRRGEPIQILIAGHPGCGKTTLLKWIALQCCEKKPIFGKYLPMFFSLKEIGQKSSLLDHSLISLFKEYLLSLGQAIDFFDDYFQNNQIIFLLDGLDEIADNRLRQRTILWIEKQNLKKNSLIVTSRYSGLDSKGMNFSETFYSFSIEDFSDQDIKGFLENWYLNVETSEVNDEYSRELARKQTYELLCVLKKESYSSLRSIAKNPLLLSIIAIVHYRKGKLPKYRFKLYEECIEILADTWLEVNRKNEMTTNYSECLYLLSLIAAEMMSNDTKVINLNSINEIMNQNGISQEKQKVFFDDVIYKAGILVESEGKFEFLHLTFQEYLAAYFYSKIDNPLKILINFDRSFWQETIKLFVNIGNTRQFFEEIINMLDEKNYLSNMGLWEDCILEEIVVEQTKIDIEIGFVNKAYKILKNLSETPEDVTKLVALFTYYSLFTTADKFIKEAEELLFNSHNSMVNILGALILLHSTNYPFSKIKKILTMKLIEWSESADPHCGLKGHDYTILIIGLNGNILDFLNLLLSLKSDNYRLKVLILTCLRDIQFIKDLDSEDSLYKNVKNLYYELNINGLIKSTNLFNLPQIGYFNTNISSISELLDLLDIRYVLRYSNLNNSNSITNIKKFRNFENLNANDKLWEFYIQTYIPLIKKHEVAINNWIEDSIVYLKSLNDEKLLSFFPNSDAKEINEFKVHCSINEAT